MDHRNAATAGLDFARALRASDLLCVIRRRRRDIERVEDIAGLSELWTWPRSLVAIAIADLVADGRIDEAADGRLIVRRRAAA